MLDAKEESKRLDQEILMLRNRLNLLEIEDEKTKKRIDETRKKTASVIKIKIRNNQMQKEKDLVRIFLKKKLFSKQENIYFNNRLKY